MEGYRKHGPTGSHEPLLAVCLLVAEFRKEFESDRAEMFEQLAPAIEGPVVRAGRKRRGRLVFGDATE